MKLAARTKSERMSSVTVNGFLTISLCSYKSASKFKVRFKESF